MLCHPPRQKIASGSTPAWIPAMTPDLQKVLVVKTAGSWSVLAASSLRMEADLEAKSCSMGLWRENRSGQLRMLWHRLQERIFQALDRSGQGSRACWSSCHHHRGHSCSCSSVAPLLWVICEVSPKDQGGKWPLGGGDRKVLPPQTLSGDCPDRICGGYKVGECCGGGLLSLCWCSS